MPSLGWSAASRQYGIFLTRKRVLRESKEGRGIRASAVKLSNLKADR